MIPLKPYSWDKSVTADSLASSIYNGYTIFGSQRTYYSGQFNTAQRKLYRNCNGFKNPDWRNKILRKEDATTPLELRIDDLKRVNYTDKLEYIYSASDRWEHRVSTRCIDPEYADNSKEFPASIDINWSSYKEARNIALTYQRKYVSDVTQPLQSQVFLGEIKETLEFLRHPFGKMRNLANSAKMARYNSTIKHYRQAAVKYRSGVFERTSQAKLLLADIADAWFEVRFALLPLVADVQAAIGVSLNHSVKKRSAFVGQGQQSLTQRITSYTDGRIYGSRVVTGDIKVKYYIHTGINFNDATNSDGLAGYLESSFLELSQFIPTVWELTPGSWFVDYFVNVSDILNTIGESPKVSRQYEVHTAVVDYRKVLNFDIGTPSSLYKIIRSGDTAYTELSRRYISRNASTDNFPSVTFYTPIKPVQLVNSALYLSRKFANIFR